MEKVNFLILLRQLLAIALRGCHMGSLTIRVNTGNIGPVEAHYPLSTLFGLTAYIAILHLPTPGLLLDHKPFSSILTISPTTDLTPLSTTSNPQFTSHSPL